MGFRSLVRSFVLTTTLAAAAAAPVFAQQPAAPAPAQPAPSQPAPAQQAAPGPNNLVSHEAQASQRFLAGSQPAGGGTHVDASDDK